MTDRALEQLKTSACSVSGAGASEPALSRRIPDTPWTSIQFSPLTEEIAKRLIDGLRAL